MKSIVVAYEDQYYDELHLLVKALRRDRGLPGMILEGAPVRGTGNFVNEVPRLLRTALKQTKRPPDRVVCLGDADRPQNLVPGSLAPAPGGSREALDAWVLAFESSWIDYLTRELKLSEEQVSRLCVRCIRWNKESVLVACPDALLAHAGARRAQLEVLLDACNPAPMKLAAEDFVSAYQNPTACLESIFRSIFAHKYGKGRDDEDLLREQITPFPARRAEVLSRCPDIERLLSVLTF